MVLSSVVFWEETKRRRNHTTEEGKFHDAAMHMPRYHKISPPGRVNRKVGRIMGNQDSKGIIDRFSQDFMQILDWKFSFRESLEIRIIQIQPIQIHLLVST